MDEPKTVPRYGAYPQVLALAKAERLGLWIPAGWDRLTDRQRDAYTYDVLENDGKLVNA